MKHLIIVFGLLFGGLLSAQVMSWTNPSFEGTAPGSSISPPGWPGCQGSPDTQPGCWGATLGASAGSTYIGLVYALSIPTSQESAGQVLPSAMVAGNPYSISMQLVNLDIYNGSWNGGAIVSIYGGSSTCNFGQQLWSSGNFVNSSWQTFSALFTPTSNWTNFIIRVEPGVGTTWPSVGIDNLLSIVLPVKLDYFDAALQGDAATIHWKTSQEESMESYTVQRSGSDMDFQDLATVPATGNDGLPQSYSLMDSDLPEGLSYYRLRMNDQNGNSTFTEVRQVLYSTTGEHFVMKSIFPNPANAFTRLGVFSLVDQQATIRVVDVAGKVIHEETQLVSAGENEFTLTTADWPAALYRVQVIAGGKASTKSLVVAH